MKPLQEYLNDTRDFYNFAIEFAIRRHKDVPTLSYDMALDKESIFRWLFRTTKMDLFKNPPEMAQFLEAAASAADDDDLRNKMNALWPVMEEYIKKIYPGIPEIHPEYGPGRSLRFNQGNSDAFPPNICIFHLFNGLAPKSFLADEAYFYNELERIVNEAEKLGCDTLYTGTWLNSNQRFLALMPEEWNNNLSEPMYEMYNNLGTNGQFVSASVGLNKVTAAYFLEHGKLKYPRRTSRCSFANVRKHIQERRAKLAEK
jgi:hypothetical protein